MTAVNTHLTADSETLKANVVTVVWANTNTWRVGHVQ